MAPIVGSEVKVEVSLVDHPSKHFSNVLNLGTRKLSPYIGWYAIPSSCCFVARRVLYNPSEQVGATRYFRSLLSVLQSLRVVHRVPSCVVLMDFLIPNLALICALQRDCDLKLAGWSVRSPKPPTIPSWCEDHAALFRINIDKLF